MLARIQWGCQVTGPCGNFQLSDLPLNGFISEQTNYIIFYNCKKFKQIVLNIPMNLKIKWILLHTSDDHSAPQLHYLSRFPTYEQLSEIDVDTLQENGYYYSISWMVDYPIYYFLPLTEDYKIINMSEICYKIIPK
nr:hypothetical protein [Abalone asfa-like virus]